jgi:polysaccharide biosynthesis transport protein
MAISSDRSAAQDYLTIVFNRKLWLIFTFIIGTLCSAIYSYSLPALYRSSTLILVEPQQIPTSYISPTVTSTVQERLTTISQQILSRTNLEKIIAQFNINRDDPEYASQIQSIIIYIHKWLNIDLYRIIDILSPNKDRTSVHLEAIIERMRKDIDVKVVGSGNAFTISYVGGDPPTTMKVTNTLASLFIEENLRLREQQAAGTTEFLTSQLLEAKRQLEKQEHVLKEFKERHMGALPGQMDANLKTLDRLQLELQTINEALRTVADRKIALQRFALEVKNSSESNQLTTRTGELENLTSKKTKLKQDLAKLQAQFNDNYPDITILKKQISETEAQIRVTEKQSTSEGSTSETSNPSESSRTQLATKFAADIVATHSEIESLKRRREQTITAIKQYEKRVEDTFANEQHLLDLTRDYEMSQKNYQALLDKRLAAKISENLERKQKGEQFRILDPANIPQRPYQPDRLKIMLLGSLLSLGLGVGIILLKEYLSPAFRRPEDFHGTIELPVLAAIPRQKVKPSKHAPLFVQEPDSVVAEQYRILYTRINRLIRERPQTIVAVSSALKGEGKTLTVLNLALVAARDFGKKTLLIDGDLKNPALSNYLNLQPQSDLVDVIFKKTDIQSTTIPFERDNLFILPIAKRMNSSSSILSSPQMKETLSMLKEQYDLILIDSPPILSLPDMNILENLVDVAVLIVRAEKTPRHAVVTAISSLISDKLVGIILNDVRQPLSRYERYYAGKI